MEKLSSGFRINRAGDDAAGRAISEKMRGQIRGLNQASRNAQDGISMIQTAEGALQETHAILQRMRELATQAANDTNVDVDRGEIQKEINQLTSEINRIGNTTEFNTQKILQGKGVDPKAKEQLNLADTGLVSQTILEGGKVELAKAAALQVKIDADADATSGSEAVIGGNIEFDFNGQTITINFKEDDENFDHGDRVINDAGNVVDLYIKDGTKKETIARLVQEALEAAISVNEDIKMEDYTISRDQSSTRGRRFCVKSLSRIYIEIKKAGDTMPNQEVIKKTLDLLKTMEEGTGYVKQKLRELNTEATMTVLTDLIIAFTGVEKSISPMLEKLPKN